VMRRVAIRGFMIVLALVFAVANAGTVLCEMDCAAGGHAESSAAITDGVASGAASHCDGERIDSARLDAQGHHGNSNGNTKHDGAHSHLRFVATVGAEVRISPAIKVSDFAVSPVHFDSTNFVRGEENFWNNNSSPPINSSFVFAAGVLRI
jgi:hypothetical protein